MSAGRSVTAWVTTKVGRLGHGSGADRPKQSLQRRPGRDRRRPSGLQSTIRPMGPRPRGFCPRRDFDQEFDGACSQHRGIPNSCVFPLHAAAHWRRGDRHGAVGHTGFHSRPRRLRLRSSPALCHRRCRLRLILHRRPIVRHRSRRRDQLRGQRRQVRDARRLDLGRRPRICDQQPLVGTGRIPLYGFRPSADFDRPFGGRRGLYGRPASRPATAAGRLQLQVLRRSRARGRRP